MKCNNCSNFKVDKSLEVDIEIYDSGNSSAEIMKCKTCSTHFLQYWAQIYDEYWTYWTEVNQKEQDQILQIKNEAEKNIEKESRGGHLRSKIMEFIHNKKEVLCRFPTNAYELQSGPNCILDGPPW